MDSLSLQQNWRPSADLDLLRLRARVLQTIREFFKQRNVLEVDTPSLSHATTTDPHIESFTTQFNGMVADQNLGSLYLITSPEFHMKRLLAAGSGSIYQVSHVFRQSELGSQHNPEFTMLEWYRVGMNYQDLMREVADLFAALFAQIQLTVEYQTYQQVFIKILEIDPLQASTTQLRDCAERLGYARSTVQIEERDVYLDYIMSHHVQPKLGDKCLTFIYEYPATQCAYARISPANTQVAERFELFIQGIELANGYHELTDAAEQLQRFMDEVEKRNSNRIETVRHDVNLVEALQAGLPDCSGVAIGLDRLIQLLSGKKSLSDVLAFPFVRA